MSAPRPLSRSFRPMLLRGAAAAGLAAAGVAAAGLGWQLTGRTGSAGPTLAAVDGKLLDRLAFVEEDVPVRDTRIYDTLAMFAVSTSEPAAWSDAPAPLLAPPPVRAVPVAPRGARAPAMPRMVALQPAGGASVGLPAAHRVTASLPPQRPAPAGGSSDSEAGAIEIAGWSVPGTQHLPSRQDAIRVADLVGSRAAALGSGTRTVVVGGAESVGGAASSVGRGVVGGAEAVGGAASSVGRTVVSGAELVGGAASRVGRSVAETIGWR